MPLRGIVPEPVQTDHAYGPDGGGQGQEYDRRDRDVSQDTDGLDPFHGEDSHHHRADRHADQLRDVPEAECLCDKMPVGRGLDGVPADIHDGHEQGRDPGALLPEAVACHQGKGQSGFAGNDADQDRDGA